MTASKHPYFKAKRAERRRQVRLAVQDFVEGARAGDGERVWRAIEAFQDELMAEGGWKAGMRAVAKISDVPDEFRERFLRGPWLTAGDHIRQEVSDDLVLCDGLRALLPRYSGPGRQLFRGDGLGNRRRRTYGLSWTSALEVARGHAQGLWRTAQGGSVVLSSRVPAQAIICAAGAIDDRYAEQEFVVDRRRLIAVEVIERFEHHPLGQQA